MISLGTVRPGSTILIPFAAFSSDDPSASVIISAFALADIGIYKALSMDERASTSGVVLLDTDGINIDAAVGIHGFSIDLSDNDAAGFYAAGSHYYVTVGPITIDAATVNFVAATFNIGYPNAIINTTVASVTSQTQFILTVGPAEADVLIGCTLLFHDVASAVQLAYGYVTDYTVTTKEVTCTDPVGFTFVATDNVSIFMPSNIHAVQGTTQTAGDLAALINTVDDFLDTEMAAQTSNLVIIASDLVVTTSDLVVVSSDTLKIESDVAAIETDTSTTLEARLSDVESSLVIIKSDLVIVESNTIVIESDTALISSDVAAIEVDTGTTLEARLSDVESSLVIVKSDLVVVESDTTRLELGLIVVTGVLEGAPSTTVLPTDLTEATDDHYNDMLFVMTSGDEAGELRRITDYAGANGAVTLDPALSGTPSTTETFVILATAIAGSGALTAKQDSDLTQVNSDMIIALSDLVVIDSGVTAIETDTGTTLEARLSDVESSLVIVKSDLVVVSSDTAVIETDTGTTLEARLSDVESSLVIVKSDLVVVSSDTVVIEAGVGTVTSIGGSTTAADKLEEGAEALVIGTVNDAGASTTVFVIAVTGDTISSVDDFYNGRIITFTTGNLLQQSTDITDYNGTTKAVTVTALTAAPDNSIQFVIS